MDTDQLIRTLAADNTHQARPVGFALMLALLAAAPVSLLMFFTELGVRPDVVIAMRNPFFDLKFAVTLALAIAAIAENMMIETRAEGVMILAKVAGMSWSTVRAIINMRDELSGAEPTDIAACKETYERLRPSTAQQVLRFHRMQQNVPA